MFILKWLYKVPYTLFTCILFCCWHFYNRPRCVSNNSDIIIVWCFAVCILFTYQDTSLISVTLVIKYIFAVKCLLSSWNGIWTHVSLLHQILSLARLTKLRHPTIQVGGVGFEPTASALSGQILLLLSLSRYASALCLTELSPEDKFSVHRRVMMNRDIILFSE